MSKYQVKQVVAALATLEAYQISDVSLIDDWPQWLKEAYNKTAGTQGAFYLHAEKLWVNELAREQVVNHGDWILKEDGCDELAVVSGPVFASMYERCEDSLEARVARLEEFVNAFSEEVVNPSSDDDRDVENPR